VVITGPITTVEQVVALLRTEEARDQVSEVVSQQTDTVSRLVKLLLQEEAEQKTALSKEASSVVSKVDEVDCP
jgi:geranylgeranyl pyrophosphate synthase